MRPALSAVLHRFLSSLFVSALIVPLSFPQAFAEIPSAVPEEDAPPVEQGRTRVVSGDGVSFVAKAPFGWMIDVECCRSEGLCAVVHPEGTSWRNAPIGMCISTSACQGDGREAFERRVADEVARHARETQPETIEDGADMLTADGKRVVVKQFLKDKWGGFTVEGFVWEGERAVVFCLKARSRDDYVLTLPAFRDLVESYALVAGKTAAGRSKGKEKS